jgi:hypothetical protein
MTKNRETSYKEAGNPVTFQVHEYSRLALCIFSCVYMNYELEVIFVSLSSAQAKRLREQCINMYWITVKVLISLVVVVLLLRCTIVIVALVLTCLYIYCLYIGLSKVRNSHYLRDLDCLFTTPASLSLQKSLHHRSTYILNTGEVNFASSFLFVLPKEGQYQS